MTSPRFVHLRLHTEYSVVDGMARVDDAVAAAAADGMPALAITDASNLFGAIKFYEAARAAGVQPVIGCDLWITNERNRDAPHRVTLLARNRAGYLALCMLLTRAHAEGHWRGRAEARREWLRGLSGLIVLSGAERGDVGMALLSGQRDAAGELARAWAADFPGAFYVEVQRVDPVKSAAFVQASAALAAEAGLPVVATHSIQFVKPGDYQAHEARVCIAQGYVLGDSRRPREFMPSQSSSFLNAIPEEMLEQRKTIKVRSSGRSFMQSLGGGSQWGNSRARGVDHPAREAWTDAESAFPPSASQRRPGLPVTRVAAFAEAEESQDAAVIAIGSRVKHRKFGSGIIVELAGAGRDLKAKIDFDDETIGRKTLVVAQANLERDID